MEVNKTKPSFQQVPLGSIIYIDCYFEGPHVTWSMLDGTLSHNVILQSPQRNTSVHSLVIISVNELNLGTYVCHQGNLDEGGYVLYRSKALVKKTGKKKLL